MNCKKYATLVLLTCSGAMAVNNFADDQSEQSVWLIQPQDSSNEHFNDLAETGHCNKIELIRELSTEELHYVVTDRVFLQVYYMVYGFASTTRLESFSSGEGTSVVGILDPNAVLSQSQKNSDSRNQITIRPLQLLFTGRRCDDIETYAFREVNRILDEVSKLERPIEWADLQTKYPTREDIPFVFWVDMSITLPKSLGLAKLNEIDELLRYESDLFKIVNSKGSPLSILNYTKGWPHPGYRVRARRIIKASIENSESTSYLVSVQLKTSSALPSEETYSLEFNSNKITKMNLQSEEVDASTRLFFVSSSIPLLHGRYEKLVTVGD